MRGGARATLLWGGLLALALGSSALLAEVALRASGRGPWRSLPRGDAPRIHDPDPVLGWSQRPGIHRFPSAARGSPGSRMTLLPGGLRGPVRERR